MVSSLLASARTTTPTFLHHIHQIATATSLFSNTHFHFTVTRTSFSTQTPPKSNQQQQSQTSIVVSYLVNSCGLSPESAASVSRKVKFRSLNNPDSVLALLRTHNFSGADISRLVRSNPTLLNQNAHKFLLPKLEFFRPMGLSSSDLATFLSSHPSLLTSSLEKHLIPCFSFFKNVAGFDDKQVLAAFKRLSRKFVFDVMDNMVPNIALLREIGVPVANTSRLVSSYPLLGSVRHLRFLKAVEDALELGFDPSQWVFLKAVRVLADTKWEWESKFELYKRWGWTRDQVLLAFRERPDIMMVSSEERVARLMDYLVVEMGWTAEDIASGPTVLARSLEKTVAPRCRVIRVLQHKGLVKRGLALESFLNKGEKYFLRTFVTRFRKHVPQLSSFYRGEVDLQDMDVEPLKT